MSSSGRPLFLLYIGVRVKGSILWLKIREGISRTPLRERGWAGIQGIRDGMGISRSAERHGVSIQDTHG